MSQSLESPRWQAVGLLIDLNTKDHLAGRHGLVEQIVAWFKAVELFRRAEDESMYLQDPTPEDLRHHQTWITSLIAEGQSLVSEARAQGGIPEGVVRFQLADVQATVESLRSDERMWHSSTLTPEQRREMLKAVFDVKKPGA